MVEEITYAAGILKKASQPFSAGDLRFREVSEILAARDEVLARYQPLFNQEHLPKLSEEEFRGFLSFRNNRHWRSLDRLGSAICKDMQRLRRALQLLVDESQPIRDRLNELVPPHGKPFVSRLSRAVLTPILLIRYPSRYGVWNQVSEAGMKALHIWPELDRGLSFGERYERMNAVLLESAAAVGVDLWTLDALWWRIEAFQEQAEGHGEIVEVPREAGIPAVIGMAQQRFGLERHLHEFLRDNWQHTPLGRDWKIYEEDGEPDAGFEYPCDIGRIDLLARHRTDPRWLVIELKRGQGSDQTVGQLLRYMGWVKSKLAGPGESVEGLVIAHETDDAIGYALSAVQHVKLQLYEVEFHLKNPPALPSTTK